MTDARKWKQQRSDMTSRSIQQDRPWLKFYETGVPESIDYEDICLPDILDRTARMFPDTPALVFEGFQVTFPQLKDMVDRFATVLVEFGIKKADSVAILLPNVIPCVVAYYAILKVGAIAVMNNPVYVDRELRYQFVDSEAKVLSNCFWAMANIAQNRLARTIINTPTV